MGLLWKTSKIVVRCGLVAGAVKLSLEADVWSLRTTRGAELYDKLKEYIVPGTIVYREKLPSVEEVQTNVFDAVEQAPSSLNTVANRLINNN